VFVLIQLAQMNCMKSLSPDNYLNNQLLVREQKLMKKKPHIAF
jgi:hypothetical protein